MDSTLQWYAIYTRSRHEKKSALLISELGIETYVPLRRVVRQWSDRRKLILEPVIRSYVFVKVDRSHYEKVLAIDGVVRYIWFGGKPAVIPEKQINIMKAALGNEVDIQAVPELLKVGMPVRVTAGPLAGMEGELLRFHGRKKVAIKLETIGQTLLFTISPLLLEPIPQTQILNP
ncbi:MAG: UpxY family transcription antiterminator [Bacteroidota bacterium]|jgi:transcription antitermination factor NusG